VTDAEWVLAVTTLGTLSLATLAAAGGRSWRSLVLTGLRTVPVALDGVAAAGRGARRVADDLPRTGRHLRTALLTAALLVVFGTLFAAADAAFANLVDLLVPDLSLADLVLRGTVGGVVALVVTTLVLLRSRPGDDATSPARHQVVGSEWSVPLGALVTLFAAFVLVRFGTLFGGDEVVQRTAGLTYAAYARQGFGQLLVVAALTLLVVAVAGRYAGVRSEAEGRTRRALLGALCVLTLVVLASAHHRLSLYGAAFGATPARVTAHATILWLAGLFVLVVVVGGLRRTDRLPRAAVLLTGVALLVFGLARPDAIVAEANVARFERTGQLDLWVVSRLSADAEPALSGLPPEVRACLGSRSAAGGSAGLSWNAARARASSLPAPAEARCEEPPGSAYP
jgi:hypothetical protein